MAGPASEGTSIDLDPLHVPPRILDLDLLFHRRRLGTMPSRYGAAAEVSAVAEATAEPARTSGTRCKRLDISARKRQPGPPAEDDRSPFDGSK